METYGLEQTEFHHIIKTNNPKIPVKKIKSPIIKQFVYITNTDRSQIVKAGFITKTTKNTITIRGIATESTYPKKIIDIYTPYKKQGFQYNYEIIDGYSTPAGIITTIDKKNRIWFTETNGKHTIKKKTTTQKETTKMKKEKYSFKTKKTAIDFIEISENLTPQRQIAVVQTKNKNSVFILIHRRILNKASKEEKKALKIKQLTNGHGIIKINKEKTTTTLTKIYKIKNKENPEEIKVNVTLLC